MFWGLTGLAIRSALILFPGTLPSFPLLSFDPVLLPLRLLFVPQGWLLLCWSSTRSMLIHTFYYRWWDCVAFPWLPWSFVCILPWRGGRCCARFVRRFGCWYDRIQADTLLLLIFWVYLEFLEGNWPWKWKQVPSQGLVLGRVRSNGSWRQQIMLFSWECWSNLRLRRCIQGSWQDFLT